MSDVRIWKTRVSKEGVFLGVDEKVFTYLRGHGSFVYWISFSSDSKKMLTCSKDNTWKFWDLDVNYKMEEHPKIIQSNETPEIYSRVELSWDNSYFAAVTETKTTIHLWNLTEAQIIHTITSPHLGQILDFSWFPNENKFATCGTDGYIRIFDVQKETDN